MKIGRNSPCPCNSGKKYKQCCGSRRQPLPTRTASPEATASYQAHMEKMRAEEQAYGHVKPIISADCHGYKYVAVGNELRFSKKWKTFPDFLLGYIKLVLGREWWTAEFDKPENDRHQIIKWAMHLHKYQKLQEPQADGTFAMVTDGISQAYLLLAYDLYILRHHQKLQARVVGRLKHPDQFQGARYELIVTATLIRAGFEIEFEDEDDSTCKHTELVAVHHKLGESIAVEAKSRHRPGVLGQPGEPQEAGQLKLGLHRLLNQASEKPSVHPLVAFVDLNVPPERFGSSEERFLEEVRGEVVNLVVSSQGIWPYALAVVTNQPLHYGQFAQPEPESAFYMCEPGSQENPLLNPAIANVIDKSLRQFGTVPNWFPDDEATNPEK